MKKMILLMVVMFFGLATAQPDDFFQASGGSHPEEIQVVSHFDMSGVLGNVFMLQRRSNDHTKLSAQFEGLDSLPGDEYGLFITDLPANRNAEDPCAAASIGDIYDPDGNLGTVNYTERCQANHSHCAIGDLATRHGSFNSTDDGMFIEFGRDFNLPTSGPRSVVGRSIVIRRLDGVGGNIACSNIEVPTQARLLRGNFSRVFQGEILLVVPRYDYVSNTKNEEVQIIVDLERVDGGPVNSQMHGWQLQRGFADESCSHLDPVLGQRRVSVGDPMCTAMNHRLCQLGDLTTKCGTLSVVNRRVQDFCTDEQLALVSFSTLNRLVISIHEPLNNRILECVQLEVQRPVGAIINFRVGRVFVHVVFSQLTQFDPTYYRTYIVGLNNMAGNLIVYDGDNPDLITCTNLGDVLDRPGRTPVANPMTSDQFPLGELGPKIGGVANKIYSRTHGLTGDVPMSGPLSIIGRPVALTRDDGTIWGCGEVEDYYNAPYQPPDDIFDYLDIWRPPTTTK